MTLPVSPDLASAAGARRGEIEGGSLARRAVVRLSAIEFWERYSFYNVMVLLTLFAATPVLAGGLGWTEPHALRFFGSYSFAVLLSPLAGGFLIDRWISARVSLPLGAAALACGHLLLALTAYLLHRHASAFAGTGLEMAGFALPAVMPPDLAGPYRAISLCFYAAILLISVGNGLFKPILNAVVGRLPHENNVEREAGFTTFFLFANLGGLGSTIVGGWLASLFGWGWAFGAAAAGMLCAIGTMAFVSRIYIRPFVQAARVERTQVTTPIAKTGHRSYAGAALLLCLTVIVSIASYLSFGFVGLFAEKMVDRHMFGFEIPATWFVALNPVTIMVLAPVLLRSWRRGLLGHDWSVTAKLAVSLALIAGAMASLAFAAWQARGGNLAGPLPLLLAVVLIAMNELIGTPAVVSAITRLVPVARQTFALGLYGAAAGLGAWLSGQLGALAVEANTMVVMLAAAIVSAAIATGLVSAQRQFAHRGI